MTGTPWRGGGPGGASLARDASICILRRSCCSLVPSHSSAMSGRSVASISGVTPTPWTSLACGRTWASTSSTVSARTTASQLNPASLQYKIFVMGRSLA